MKLRSLFIIATAFLLSGCRQPTSDVDMFTCQQLSATAGEFDSVQLLNCAAEEVWVGAVELQSSHFLDPMPWYDLDGTIPHPKWAPGEERAIDNIMGYTYGDDVRLFIYLRGWVTVGGVEVEKIVLGGGKDATHAELLESAGLIILSSGASAD